MLNVVLFPRFRAETIVHHGCCSRYTNPKVSEGTTSKLSTTGAAIFSYFESPENVFEVQDTQKHTKTAFIRST